MLPVNLKNKNICVSVIIALKAYFKPIKPIFHNFFFYRATVHQESGQDCSSLLFGFIKSWLQLVINNRPVTDIVTNHIMFIQYFKSNLYVFISLNHEAKH